MKTFKVNGISVNDHEGSGKPLVFIHAFPLCSRIWDEQVNFFKDKYRIITYDIRGLGYSNETGDDQFTMEELVNDLFNILDHMKLDKVIACGLSVGGYILLRALVRDQKRFESVILSDTKSEAENNESILDRSEMILALKSGKRDEVLEGLLKKLISNKSYQNESLKSFVRTMMSWMDVKGITAVILAIATRTNTFFQLKNINIPAMIIAGKEDLLTPPINSFNLKNNLKNARMKIIPEVGHLSNMEAPEEFNKIIESFLLTLK